MTNTTDKRRREQENSRPEEDNRTKKGARTGAFHGAGAFWRALSRGRGRDGDGPAGQAIRRALGKRLERVLRGVCLAFFGGLMGSAEVAFGAAPLGLALLCAGTGQTWYILLGLLAAAFIHPVMLSAPAWVGVYTLCILMRLGALLFIDPPRLPGEVRQPGLAGHLRYAGRYLVSAFRSAAVNTGFAADPVPVSEPEPPYVGPRARPRTADGIRSDADRPRRPAGSTPRRAVRRVSGGRRPENAAHPAGLFCEHPLLRALTGAAVGLTAGITAAVTGGFHVYDLLGALLMLLAVPAASLLLAPIFSPAGEALLFDARPSVTGMVGLRRGRMTAVPIAAAFLCLSAVFCAGSRAFVIGTPYLSVRLSTLLGLLFTLSASSRLGLPAGLLTALLCGLGAEAALMPIFLLTAAVYAFLHILSHRAGIVGGCTAGAIWCAACGDLGFTVAQLPSVLLAAPVWLLIETLWDKLPGMADVRAGADFVRAETGQALLEAQNTRLSALSGALLDLSRTLEAGSETLRRPPEEALRQMCGSAVRQVCADCPRRADCPGSRESRAADMAVRLSDRLSAGGRADADCVPPDVQAVCPRIGALAADVNSRFAALTQAAARGEKTHVLAADYARMAEMLTDVLQSDEPDADEVRANREAADGIYACLTSLGAEVQGVAVCGRRSRRIVVRGHFSESAFSRATEIRDKLGSLCGVRLSDPVFESDGGYTVMTLTSEPRFGASYSGSTVPAGGAGEAAAFPPPLDGSGTYAPPPVCGDHIAVFRGGEASLCALISDGMGSGKEASDTSALCAVFLEKMLSAGNKADISLRMLNSLLLARNETTGRECSAAVDLMELDTVVGQAVFAKNGAAPTYVVRGGTVYKLRTRSLPLGILRDSAPQLLRFRMHPGDVVVMVSDGVTLGNDECPWLIDLLSTPLPDSMDSLRLDILRRAVASGSPDDLSAIAIRVDEEKDGR